MKLNPRLAKRPRFKGLPVPYVQFIRTDGVPDFRVVDEAKKARCIQGRLCGLCGEPLEALIAFVGGPMCVRQRLYDEPPFHLNCAHDAFRICPYLVSGKDHFQGKLPTGKVPEGMGLVENPMASDVRPEFMAILVARSYRLHRHPRGHAFVLAGSPVRVEWYDGQGQRVPAEAVHAA